MLRQFDDPDCVRRLLALPEKLMVDARRKGAITQMTAVKAQTAAAIAILLAAPMRPGNLASLNIEEHILRPNPRKGGIVITISGDQVKNEEPLTFPLPARTTVLVDAYIDDYLPHLGIGPGCWLFPGGNGRPKGAGTLGDQISKSILKHAGIAMTAHQFRHLAAKLLLDRDPGAVEVVRRLLNHKSLRTTFNHYAEISGQRAAAYYQEVILDLQAELDGAAPRAKRLRRPAI